MQGIYREGGFSAVAQRLGVPMNRRRKHHWDTIDAVGKELQTFIEDKGLIRNGRPRMPTQAELVHAGRADLKYAIQKHGHCKLAEFLGAIPSQQGV